MFKPTYSNNLKEATTEPGFKVMCLVVEDRVEVQIMDAIGPGGVEVESVQGFLAEHSDKPVRAKVNSPGGLAYDGIALMNAFDDHPQDVTAEITGQAYSAAAIAVMGADRIEMREGTRLGIHRAHALLVGNALILRDVANELESLDGDIASIFAQRSGQTAEKMLELMDGKPDGTSFRPEDAVSLGLADGVIAPEKRHKAARASRLDPKLESLLACHRLKNEYYKP